jgi:LuxR family maltose regulon positive regulatory protein
MLAAKLRPPPPRPGHVARAALVDGLLAREVEPIIAVVAPPGYGKTTLLAQWARRHPRRVAWVSVDEGDDDPAVLLASIATALSAVQRVDPRTLAAVASGTVALPTALAALTSALAPAERTTLVLDNVEALTNVQSLDLVAELVWRLPLGSRLAYGSRAPLPLPVPVLRTHGDIVEIGRDDLAMDREEAEQLLCSTGAELTPDEVDALLEQTEGWPAGLYLAGLAANGRRPSSTPFSFRGDDVLMGDYLRTEVLDHLPTDTVRFLTRTSVLEQMSAASCDAVVGADGSQAVLESLEAAGLLLVPLDRQRTWYRYHRLFRDLLATELEQREPELLAALHGRAARWLEANGMPEQAIRQAQRADDPDLVVSLVAATTPPAYAAGRAKDAHVWLEWFRDRNLIEEHPQVAVVGALVEALSGRAASAERWAAAAESAGDAADHGATFTGMLAYLRTVLCRRGVAEMGSDARHAADLLGPQHGLHAAALLFEGLAFLLAGDPDGAEPRLAHAHDVAMYSHSMPAATASAAFRGFIAVGRKEWDVAQSFADTALEIVETGHLYDYLEATTAHALAAQTAGHRGDSQAAVDHLARAARGRPLCTYAVPATALVQLELARAYLQVGDATGARTVLREVRDLLHQRPDLGVVPEQAEALRRSLDAIRQGPVSASALTAAELRLLPFLATHLSFPEIGERLHVSRHTVKTQAISVYRKFGVSSRSEAIRCAHDVGLLGM